MPVLTTKASGISIKVHRIRPLCDGEEKTTIPEESFEITSFLTAGEKTSGVPHKYSPFYPPPEAALESPAIVLGHHDHTTINHGKRLTKRFRSKTGYCYGCSSNYTDGLLNHINSMKHKKGALVVRTNNIIYICIYSIYLFI